MATLRWIALLIFCGGGMYAAYWSMEEIARRVKGPPINVWAEGGAFITLPALIIGALVGLTLGAILIPAERTKHRKQPDVPTGGAHGSSSARR